MMEAWLHWYWMTASQRFQKEYSGQRTDWNTKQEWDVWWAHTNSYNKSHTHAHTHTLY